MEDDIVDRLKARGDNLSLAAAVVIEELRQDRRIAFPPPEARTPALIVDFGLKPGQTVSYHVGNHPPGYGGGYDP